MPPEIVVDQNDGSVLLRAAYPVIAGYERYTSEFDVNVVPSVSNTCTLVSVGVSVE